MIALLTGQLASKTTERIILDVNGVGYQVAIPLSSFYSLPDEGNTTLHIYTHVREDSLLLFGFLTLLEKEMFILLLSISGIGPKVALNILSHMSCTDLHAALTNGDAKRLATLPGIGKKTAQRLVLELRDKIGKLSNTEELNSEQQITYNNDSSDDILSALINLGYKEKQAAAAIAKTTISADDSMETILKATLKHLIR
ncbi:MAG: Holliday junction branch migration protein RuvA [Desulfobacteraceae bacterium 4572_35.1]|nr:MAG: Holliday junction branch migration protein RuvA [Desulfobacteraceae bacterium 4572_35.1]